MISVRKLLKRSANTHYLVSAAAAKSYNISGHLKTTTKNYRPPRYKHTSKHKDMDTDEHKNKDKDKQR